MKIIRIIVIVLALVLCRIEAIAIDSTFTRVNNIPYYSTDTIPYVKNCTLDIYFSKSDRKLPVLIWFHGGGLTSGEKEIPSGLMGQNLLVVGVGYRLSPMVNGKKCIEDAAAAIAWVFRNIHTYNGDSNLIFVAGHSAGAYLTSMVVLDKSYLKKHSINSDKIAGFFPLSGHAITHFTIRKEQNIAETQPLIDEMAPLFYVRKNIPPVLLVTGDREMELLGRYEENAYFYRMLKVVGNSEVYLVELKNQNHGMADAAFPIVIEYLKKFAALDKSKRISAYE